jgi:hypothetical protein
MKVDGAVMVLRFLGNFDRYCVQLFRILYKMGNDDNGDNNNNDAEETDGMLMTCCVAYHTLTGGHFDGEFRFSVEETTKDDSGAVVVSVTLAIPNGSQAPPVRLAKAMVLSFAHSITRAIWIQTEQTLTRRRRTMSGPAAGHW